MIDRVLNIVHMRSDLSSWFVAGGKRTLDKLANESVNEYGDAAPAAQASPGSSGSTTEDNISYLPARMGERGKPKRAKKKKERNLVHERERMLREAINKDLKSLRSELKVQLNKLFDGEAFLLLGNHLSSWKATFGVSAFRTNKIAVPVENKSRGIQKIYGQLLREYGKDKGNLEMLISAIQDGRPLGQFSVFDKFDNLFGSRAESVVDGIKVIFEETIDFILDLSQSIYISDLEVLDLVEEEFKGSIKRSKNLIFPIGGKFRVGFYSHLKSVIEDSQTREEDDNES
ncbi:MAG: hypothetical protein ACTSRU_21630 [Candidatus Hodarchaeales archaeon]